MKTKHYFPMFAFGILLSFASGAQIIVDPLLRDVLRLNLTSLFSPPVEVIVTFKGTGAPTSSQLKILRDLGIKKGVAFRSFPVAGVLATASQIRSLERNSAIRSLYLNKKLKYFNDYSTELTGVDRMREDPVMIANNGGIPVTGAGVGVLINDSGIDGSHPDIKFGDHLVQNVLGTTNLANLLGILPPTYIENVESTDVNSGHGTHCAGIVGATGDLSAKKYEGVAPGADLIGYGSGALLFILDALGGLDYAATHQQQYGIRVVSNSWGTDGPFDPADPVNIATKALYDKGIVTVFAAGNAGPDPGTLNPYSLAPWVISVAAGDRNRQLADFSSRGVSGDQTTFTLDGQQWVSENRPTLTAPGVDIVSTRAIAPLPVLATQMDINNLDPAHLPYYTHMSGTSMATPHVAGIVALMLEANPMLSPSDIKDIVQFTSLPMPGYETWEAGWGYADAFNAVSYAFFVRDNSGARVSGSNPLTDAEEKNMSEVYSLSGYPNPFSNTLTINYTLPGETMVNLIVMDKQGRPVATLVNEHQVKGTHQVQVEKANFNLAPGLYIAKLKTDDCVKSFKVMVRD